jgi:hypothetical protein
VTPLTLYLARLYGVGLLLMCGIFVARPDVALAAIQSIAASPGLLLMAGLFALFSGVAMVVGHNRWSGGAVTIVITVLGWMSLLKGVAVLAAPPGVLQGFYSTMGYPGSFPVVMAVAGLFSLWLIWAGFRARPAPGS